MKRLIVGVCAALLASTALPALAAPKKAEIGDWGIDTSGLSKTVRPGDDFYRYVNEGWLKTAKIPAGLPMIDMPTDLYLSTEQRVGKLIKTTVDSNPSPGTSERQIADYYRSHADQAKRNALGLTPIADKLKQVEATRTHADIARLMAQPWLSGMIESGVLASSSEPARQIVAVVQAGLTLPALPYYLEAGEPYASVRAALRDYIAGSFRRAGYADAEARADQVMAVEMALAKVQWSTAQTRDVVRMDHVMTPAELKAYAPGFPWDEFLTAFGYGKLDQIKVATDTAVRDSAKIFAETPVASLQSYLLFHTLDNFADALSDDWHEAYFDFHSRKLAGIAQQRAPELQSIASANGLFGEEIGRIYVKEYFPPAYRADLDQMVGYLRASFRDRIGKLAWMDAPTRAEATAKLDKVTSYIGYPDRWHDRSSVKISPDDLVGNQLRMIEWSHADSLKKLQEGTRNWEFPYKPQEINAGYNPSRNSITFPAGFLQSPYYDPAADAAVNFGAIGAVIGHEFGHGFDDQGSRSDGEGRLRDWWTPAARAEFEKRTSGLVEQFNGYEPVPGTKINGRQNLGENIGDLGGLSIAYAAYRKFVDEKQGGKAPVIGGFTGDQRFFLSWSQAWRNLSTESETRRRLLSDNHSPGEYRVNGIVRNVDAWYDAFGIKPSDKLYLPPEKRVKIW